MKNKYWAVDSQSVNSQEIYLNVGVDAESSIAEKIALHFARLIVRLAAI